jgi:hypothetical protein
LVSCTGQKSCEGSVVCASATCQVDCSGTQSCPNSVCCYSGSCTRQPSTLTCRH